MRKSSSRAFLHYRLDSKPNSPTLLGSDFPEITGAAGSISKTPSSRLLLSLLLHQSSTSAKFPLQSHSLMVQTLFFIHYLSLLKPSQVILTLCCCFHSSQTINSAITDTRFCFTLSCLVRSSPKPCEFRTSVYLALFLGTSCKSPSPYTFTKLIDFQAMRASSLLTALIIITAIVTLRTRHDDGTDPSSTPPSHSHNPMPHCDSSQCHHICDCGCTPAAVSGYIDTQSKHANHSVAIDNIDSLGFVGTLLVLR